VVGGECAVQVDGDCQRSDACRDLGSCAASKGKCVVSAEGCKQIAFCKLIGHCTPLGDKCGAASDEDCRASDVCRVGGRCRAAEGDCVK